MIKANDIEKVSRAVIGSAFGMHPSNVNRWEKRGCPRNPDGKTFSLPDVLQWRLEELALDGSSVDNEESQKWLAVFRKERSLLAKIERKKAEGSLIKADNIFEMWSWRVRLVRDGLLRFSNRLPGLLHGKSKKEIHQILEAEAVSLLDAYREKSEYCPEIPDSEGE